MIALFIIIPIIVLIGAGIWCGIVSYKKYDDGESKALVPQIVISALFCLASILVLVFVPGSFHQVDAGEVAVVKVWGDAKYTRSAGMHYDLWISHKYEVYDAKVQQIEISTAAYSKDSQPMDIQLYVQYQIKQDEAMEIAKDYGSLATLESKIQTVAIERTKSVLSTYVAKGSEAIGKEGDANYVAAVKGLIINRTEASNEVSEAVKKAIDKSYYANITTVVLTEIDFSDAFEKSVEETMIAEQQKLKAEAEKAIAITKAEQELEVAKKEAEAKFELAQGDAKAQKAIAEAEAYATQIKVVELAKSLGYEVTGTETTGFEINWDKNQSSNAAGQDAILAYLQYLEYLNKWNGELPDVVTGSNGTIMITPPTSSDKIK